MVHFWLHYTVHCKDSMSVERVGQGEVGRVTAVCCGCGSCKEAMIGSEWVNSHPGCMNRQRKCYSYLLGVHSRQGRLLGFEGYLPTKNANYILHAR